MHRIMHGTTHRAMHDAMHNTMPETHVLWKRNQVYLHIEIHAASTLGRLRSNVF